jgi:MYXO-CTERM domain-containing protein
MCPGEKFLPDGIDCLNVFTPGDIGPNNPNGFSDQLQFHQGGPTGGLLTYLSLLDDNEPPDLADVVGLVPAGGPAVLEMGPEGNNGFVWGPTPSGAIYQGISDTPEPSTFILGGLGLLALFLIGRRRRAAA